MKEDLFDMLCKSILETQEDGQNTLYFSGKFVGYGYKIDKVENLTELKKLLNNILDELDLGRVEKIEDQANNIMISIYGNFTSENHFVTGLITGLISKALDYNFYKFKGREIKGRRKGKKYVFEIKSI